MPHERILFMGVINKIRNKFKNKKGESLPEVLATMLIIALSIAGVFTASAVTRNIMDGAEKAMKETYGQVTELDCYITADGAELPGENDETYKAGKCHIAYSGDNTVTQKQAIETDAYFTMKRGAGVKAYDNFYIYRTGG